MPQQTQGLASAITSPGTLGQVRPYSGNTRPLKHACVVEVMHPGTQWEPADYGSIAHCEQAFREVREEMRYPITGVRILSCATGAVLKEDTVESLAATPPPPTRKRHKRKARRPMPPPKEETP